MKHMKSKKYTETKVECSRDGLIIRGTEYRPEGENLPIAIVSHGFMAFQDTVRQYAKTLAELGYVSYCFDFCGGSVVKGKSDGSTKAMSVLTEVKDLEAVIEYTKSKSYTDSEDILLMGCSQGGLVSAITAAKHKHEISKLVLFYPAFCIPDDARAGKMMLAKFDPDHIPETISCGPMKLGRCYVEDVIHMNPYQETKEFGGDILIVHGTKDSIVGMDYIDKAYKNYKEYRSENKLSNHIELKIIEGGKHMFSKKHDVLAIEYLNNFCNSNE